jgi:uncharacterized protein YbjT (DUF2867 family)
MLLALTGATGFIGQHLLRELPERGHRLRVLLRRPAAVPIAAASAVIGDLARPRNMAAALEGVDAVIHSAGIAHAMSGIPEDDYRLVNTEATIGLARGRQAFHFSLYDPRAMRTGDRHGHDRSGRAGADGCLREVQARGRTRPGGSRH